MNDVCSRKKTNEERLSIKTNLISDKHRNEQDNTPILSNKITNNQEQERINQPEEKYEEPSPALCLNSQNKSFIFNQQENTFSSLTKITKNDRIKLREFSSNEKEYQKNEIAFRALIFKPADIKELKKVFKSEIDTFIYDTKKLQECKLVSTISALERNLINLKFQSQTILNFVLSMEEIDFAEQFRNMNSFYKTEKKFFKRSNADFCYKSFINPLVRFYAETRKKLILQSLIDKEGLDEFSRCIGDSFQELFEDARNKLFDGLSNLPDKFLSQKLFDCQPEKLDRLIAEGKLKDIRGDVSDSFLSVSHESIPSLTDHKLEGLQLSDQPITSENNAGTILLAGIFSPLLVISLVLIYIFRLIKIS